MNGINQFSLEEHKGEYENRPLTSMLYYSGQALGIKVPGYVIDKQYEYPDYFLLFLSWDCPFEEGCEIIVLDKDYQIVANHSLSPPYNSYHLTDVIAREQDHYTLTFNGTERFALTVNYPKKKRFRKVLKLSKIDH